MKKFYKLVNLAAEIYDMTRFESEQGMLFVCREPYAQAATACNKMLAYMPLSEYGKVRKLMATLAEATDLSEGEKAVVTDVKYRNAEIIVANTLPTEGFAGGAQGNGWTAHVMPIRQIEAICADVVGVSLNNFSVEDSFFGLSGGDLTFIATVDGQKVGARICAEDLRIADGLARSAKGA